MTSGTNVTSAITPNRCAMRPVRKICDNTSERLHDPVEPREDARAVGDLRIVHLDQPQLLEVQQRVHRRDHDHEQRDAEDVRRTQDQRHTGEHVAADGTIFRPVGRRARSCQMPSSRRWQKIAATNNAAPRNSMPLLPISADRQVGHERPQQRAGAAARGDRRRTAAWSARVSNSSSRKLQKIDSRNRLTTLMKT